MNFVNPFKEKMELVEMTLKQNKSSLFMMYNNISIFRVNLI